MKIFTSRGAPNPRRVDIYLAEKGIEVWETDLGEFIVQLAGESPSHIIAPAIHMNREEVARLFEEKLGVEYTDDPEELTMTARRVLRETIGSGPS